MADYGITPTGFKRKRLDQILLEKNAAVTEVFGPDINLTPQSPDGQINGVLSESDALLWELAQAAYDAFNPDAATQNLLDNLVEINGINRLQATPSKVTLSLTGINGTVVTAGALVATPTGIQYSVDQNVTISGGSATVAASAVIPGATQTLAGQLTEIVTPIAGWSTVNNLANATVGLDEETDSELRLRRARSVAFPSQSLLESIFSAIANLTGVEEVIVLENDTNVVDANGQDPHSVQAIVLGGDDQEIAEAIFNEKATGITTVGSTTVPVTDVMGVDHDINFQRPTLVDIYVIVNLTVDSDYPGDDEVKEAIVNYANGDLVQGKGFGIGDDVIYSRLYTPINSVCGHQIDSLFIGTAPSPTGTVNIPIAFNQLSNFTTANITVNS